MIRSFNTVFIVVQ